jgi:hypothetical protein
VRKLLKIREITKCSGQKSAQEFEKKGDGDQCMRVAREPYSVIRKKESPHASCKHRSSDAEKEGIRRFAADDMSELKLRPPNARKG